jgi:hypothetical protein
MSERMPQVVRQVVGILAATSMLAAGPASAGGFGLEYLHNLATPTGDIRSSGLRLSWDPAANELFAIGYGAVGVFNASGMEIYRFGDDAELGNVVGLAALENGDLLVLAYRDGKAFLVLCDYRGEPLEEVKLSGLPPGFESFRPGAIAYVNGKIYLSDPAAMKVLLADAHGAYVASYDIAALLDLDQKRDQTGLSGFGVDKDGNILVTVAPEFKAAVVSLKGDVRFWGKAGGGPGRFNVIAGISADDAGRYYVVDSLKCAVIVFDKDLKFIGEYGYRGYGPGRLIAPNSVAVGNDRVFVAQNGKRGVTVYRILAQ